jgi:capsular polysaccharide biosynthesis protein
MYEEQFDQIDLREIFQIIRKHLALIIIIPIIFAAVGAAVSIFFIDRLYESSTTLIVMQDIDAKKEISKTDVDLSKSLIYTYAEMAKSNTVLENTAKALNIDKLNKKDITVSPVKDTQILKVTVQNTNPDLAKNIADTLVKQFTSEIQRITKTNNVSVVDYARLPVEPIRPNIMMNTVISGILGAMLIILSIFLREYLDNTVKAEKDIENLVGISVIGSVPNFNQGGKQAYGKVSYKRQSFIPNSGSIQKNSNEY